MIDPKGGWGLTKRWTARTVVLVACATLLGCTPKLEAPRESVRVTGTVDDVDAPPPPPPPAGTPVPAATPVAGAVPKPAPVKTYPVLTTMPLGVAVYEACSPQLYFFKKCPGKFLGEAKLTKPGPFVVEIDTKQPEVVVFAFRGFLGPEQEQEACAEAKVTVAEAGKPLALKLQAGTCSIKLEKRYG